MELFLNAEWIFAQEVGEEQIADRYFSYKTNLNTPSGKATLYISSHSQYAVYINGIFVNCGQYDDYVNYQIYDTLDLSDYIKTGDNELLICQYVCGTDTSTHSAQIPGIIFAAYDGDTQLAVSSPSVLSGEDMRYAGNGELFTSQLGYNFSYNATVSPPVFTPSVLAGKQKNLFPRPVDKLTILPLVQGEIVAQGVFRESDSSLPKARRLQTAFLSARRRKELFSADTFSWDLSDSESADGIYTVLDMGGETAGLLSFSVDVPHDTEILIGIGEHLDDLRVRSFVGGRNFAFRYVAKAGHNEFFHPFQRLGLRYIQLHICSLSGTLHTAGLRPTVYPLTVNPNPMTDRLHRRIWDVSCKTLSLCMHEHYEDSPWREQALYAMDSRIQMLCGYYAFGEKKLPRATLRLMANSLREDNLLELCPPGKVRITIPVFTAVYVREVWEYVQFTGDITLACDVLETLEKICDGFISHIDETGLILPRKEKGIWNFYEWNPGMTGYEEYSAKTYELPLCAFVTDTLRCYANILRALKKDTADYYEDIASKLAKSTHEHFYDEKNGGYLTRMGDEKPTHALTQALMLFAGIVPDRLTDTVASLITDNTLIPCSLSMTIYAYEGLLKHGDSYRDYVLSEIETLWGDMIFKGADTFWETKVGADDFSFAGSLCHGWSAVPVYIFSHYNLP